MAEQKVQERMAQILHDDLQQILYGARMHIKLIEEHIEEEPEVVVSSLKELDSIVAESLELTRRLISDLAPPVLDRQDLGEVFRNLAARMRELHKLNVVLETTEIPLIADDNLRLLIYQVVRELLFNVVKHAHTNVAKLTITCEEGKLYISVEDHGRGFDISSVEPGKRGDHRGYGLPHATERLSWMGGELEYDSTPGAGTCVRLVMPLPAA
jgi:signal transduction histidine kinase